MDDEVIKRPKIDNRLCDQMDDQTSESNRSCDQMDDQTLESIDNENGVIDFSCTDLILQYQGAEARLYRGTYLGKSVIVKERFPKSYRHPKLDDQLRRERLKSEIRCMTRCRSVGIAVPPLYFVDPIKNRLVLSFIADAVTVREYIYKIQKSHRNIDDRDRILFSLADAIGQLIAVLHANDVIHGDLTTSNMLIRSIGDDDDQTDHQNRLVLIDFGLSYIERLAEDKGVDLYVLEKAFLSTHPDTEVMFERILASYGKNYVAGGGGKKALDKLADVRLRGRKREMIG